MISHASRRGRADALAMLESLGLADGRIRPAAEVVANALDYAGVEATELPASDPLLAGAVGVLDRDVPAVWYRAGLRPETRTVLLAHELGHWWMHGDANVFLEQSADDTDHYHRAPAVLELEGYSPVQRTEIEATSFASELLAPGPGLVEAFRKGWSARELADAIGVREDLVVRQLVMHVLEVLEEASPKLREAELCPEPEQRAAAEATDDVTIVVAGPGTGKTATLAWRVHYLLGQGVRPEAILALTFSRNAAEEMRSRVAALDPVEGHRVQIYTTHACGLKLLRVYGRRLGIPPVPTIVTPVRSLAMLEEHLREAELRELLCVENPAYPLAEVVHAIARWKGTGRSPDALASVPDAPASFREAVALYRSYEDLLRKAGALDYADLIGRAVELLRTCPDVLRGVCSRLEHILVDEVQDLDDLSLELLHLLHRTGIRLWLVGDPAQAIYGFRGAGQRGCAKEALPMPHRRVELRAGHRCNDRIARVLNEFARQTRLETVSSLEEAPTTPDGCVEFVVAHDEAAQLQVIYEGVQRNLRMGIGLGAQAVLCRTNGQAQGIARGLKHMGIGVRAAETLLSHWAVREALAAMRSSAEAGRAVSISTGSTAEEPSSLGRVLSDCYFGEAGLARRVAEDSIGRRALAWFYWFVAEREYELQAAGLGNLYDRFEHILADLRRAVALREDREVVLSSECDTEAVSVITIHAAKGLEFDAVFVPSVNVGHYPPRTPPQQIEQPDGDAEDTVERIRETEARLLYVAMSRARRCLTVSVCQKLHGREARPSELAEPLRAAIEIAGGKVRTYEAEAAAAPNAAGTSYSCSQEVLALEALDSYEDCPRRFLFARETPTRSRRREYNAYWRGLHEAVRAAREAVARGDSVREAAFAAWRAAWLQYGVAGNLAEFYEQLAAVAIERVASSTEVLTATETTFQLELEHGCIRARADGVRVTEDGSIAVEVYRYRYRPDTTRSWSGSVILRKGAEAMWPGREVKVGTRYLLSDDVVWYPANKRTDGSALAKYDRFLLLIAQQQFPTRVSDRCAYCEFLFQCSRSPDGDE